MTSNARTESTSRFERIAAFAPDPRGVFITCVLLLLTLGTILVYSSSAFHWSVGDDATQFLRRQLSWLPLAFLGCFVASRVPVQWLAKWYWQPLAFTLVLLLVVLIPQLGRNVNASRRWLPLGGGLQIQPSELAKIAVIIFVAGFLAADPERRHRFFRGFLLVSLGILPVFAAILVEPDLGSAVFVLSLGFIVLLLGGARLWYFIASAVLFAPLLSAFVYLRWEHVQKRFLGFLDPDQIYQVTHSLTALGSGGAWGLGLGAGGQKLRFLPEPHTDFILAICGEELGYAGCMAVILLFVLLLWSGIAMVRRVRGLFPFLVGAGIVISITLQAVFNVAVVTASAPTKGIPLPFITFGGSGLCVLLAQVGLLLGIDRRYGMEPTLVPAAAAIVVAPAPVRAPALVVAEDGA